MTTLSEPRIDVDAIVARPTAETVRRAL